MKPPTLFANCIPAAVPPWISVLFLLVFVFCAPADSQEPCPDRSCPPGITNIGDCPDEGCRKKPFDPYHPYDSELNKRKNIRPDDPEAVGPAKLRTIRWIKALPDPMNLTECGSRDELKQLGEGQKVMVVAWALTAKPEGAEKCNCDLTHVADTDNHIVLVDTTVNNPTLAKDEDRSVTAEFTPRVRLKHPKFTRKDLNSLISPSGKLLVRVTGLLMFDSGHFFGDPLTRDTNWEIHPILKLEYCPDGETCRANSDKNWVDLEKH
jgi:hypothetical protein